MSYNMNMDVDRKYPAFTFRLDDEKMKKLKELARIRNVTIAKVIRDGIEFQIKVMESQLDVFKQKGKD